MKTTNLDSFDQRNQKKHTKDLGLQLPKDYFSKSKANFVSKSRLPVRLKVPAIGCMVAFV